LPHSAGGEAATEGHRNPQKNYVNRYAAPSYVATGLGLAFPALFLLPGGVKGDIIPGREDQPVGGLGGGFQTNLGSL